MQTVRITENPATPSNPEDLCGKVDAAILGKLFRTFEASGGSKWDISPSKAKKIAIIASHCYGTCLLLQKQNPWFKNKNIYGQAARTAARFSKFRRAE